MRPFRDNSWVEKVVSGVLLVIAGSLGTIYVYERSATPTARAEICREAASVVIDDHLTDALSDQTRRKVGEEAGATLVRCFKGVR